MKPPLALALLLVTLPLSAAEEFAAAEATASDHGLSALTSSVAGITEGDLRRFVTRLASEEYEGRGTGDRGERMATAYLTSFLAGLDLQPAGDEGSFYQNFEFRAGMELKGANSLTLTIDEPVGLVRRFEPGEHYQPLSLSSSGKAASGVVFAGFGIEGKDYNSFEGLAVEGKWLMVLRGSPKDRKDLERHGPFVAKCILAKKKGAAGVIFVKATNPALATELIAPSSSVGGPDQILPAITITDRLAAAMLTGRNDEEGLKALFAEFHSGGRVTGHALPWRVEGEIGVEVNRDPGRNVLARLVVGEERSEEAILIGAHIDHLGYGNRGGSRAKGAEAKKIHFGADDNASGVAAVMELAQFFADQKRAGTLKLKRDLVFAAWSGEEVGLRGSRHYVEQRKKADGEVYPAVAAYLNLDMVGRARDKGLILHGTGSSKEWGGILDALAEVPGLEIKRSASPFIPTDSTPFYQAGVPVLAAFTGLHDDYHTPADTVDKVDFAGLGLVSHYLKGLTIDLAQRPSAPAYEKFADNPPRGPAPKVRLGMIPEDVDGHGVRIAQVVDDTPAAQAGFLVGDLLTRLNGAEIKNVRGLFEVLRKMEPKKQYDAVVERGGENVAIKITPEAR